MDTFIFLFEKIMFQSIHKLRVRYSETDRMGYVYYGNYAQYFEVGRVETMRKLNMSYKQIEDSGIIMPVRDLNIQYFKPAFYDDELTIETSIPKLPEARILFEYRVLNEKSDLICTASTHLVFVDPVSGRPMRAPDYFMERLKPFFN